VVLPPGELNGIIQELFPVCCESVDDDSLNVFSYCCMHGNKHYDEITQATENKTSPALGEVNIAWHSAQLPTGYSCKSAQSFAGDKFCAIRRRIALFASRCSAKIVVY